MTDPDKLIVFVDYQNAYMSAREVFYSDADHYTRGQFNPLKLGELLVERDNATRTDGSSSVLHQVRVYCGLPDSEKDPRGNGARLWRFRVNIRSASSFLVTLICDPSSSRGSISIPASV